MIRLCKRSWRCVKYMKLWEVDIMAQVYANLIKRGLKTIDDVPAKLREEVLAILKAGDANA